MQNRLSPSWSPLLRLLLALTASGFVPGCGSVLPSGDDGSNATPHTTPPDSTPAAPVPARLSNVPLVRRLALDLGAALPAGADALFMASSPENFNQLIDTYLNDRRTPAALAALHSRMWHLSSAYLPDLDAFAAAGNTALAGELTEATRLNISLEPTATVRWVLDQGLAFGEAFRQGPAVVNSNLLSLWGETATATAFIGEPYVTASYGDGRPAAGILASNGMLASFASRGDPHLRQRTSQVLEQLLCLGISATDAHQFAGLTAAELATDLPTLATQKSECASCHSQFEDMGRAYNSLASATTLPIWLNYTPPASPVTGSFIGQTFIGLGGAANLVATDPRLTRCEADRLLTALYQRQPSQALDSNALAAGINAYNQGGQDLRGLSRSLLQSPEYSFGLFGTAKGPFVRGATGIKFLTRAQWQGLADALVPGVAMTFSDALDPGHYETFTSDDAMPSGPYWHAVDRAARQLAAAIVTAELAPGVPATSRRVLTMLADGTGAGAGSDVVTKQIQAVWLLLTGAALQPTDAAFLSLQTLWNSAGIGASASEAQRGWSLVLTAMLASPGFVSY